MSRYVSFFGQNVPLSGPTDANFALQDLLGLVPGMSLAQWISGRLVAQGMRGLAWIGRSFLWSRPVDAEATPSSAAHRRRPADEEQGLSSAGAYAKAVREATK